MKLNFFLVYFLIIVIRYEEVIVGLIKTKHENPEAEIVSNSVMMSFNSLVFRFPKSPKFSTFSIFHLTFSINF